MPTSRRSFAESFSNPVGGFRQIGYWYQARQAGFSEAQAAAVLEAVGEAVNEHTATKADLKDFELRLTKEMTDKFDTLNARLLNGAMVIIAALSATTAGAVFTLFQLLK